MIREKLVSVAIGDSEPDLVLRNAEVLDVFSGSTYKADIAICSDRIVGLGNYRSKYEIDLRGLLVLPGFIDAHLHIESSMVSIPEFARAVLPRGTTTVVADPHEIANVLGTRGIDYMLEEASRVPLSIYFMLPSCVPATPFETSGAVLTASDLAGYVDRPEVLGLAEVMNFPGVIAGDEQLLAKIGMAISAGKVADGHAPGLSGEDLCAYIAAGISSDHECVSPSEAAEKITRGMHIMVREGTGAKNLESLLSAVTPQTSGRMMWCTDDRHPHDILDEGHIDFLIRKAVSLGLDPVTAVRMATINPAQYFGLRMLGAVACGYRADLVVTSSLERLDIKAVFCGGKLVAKDGSICDPDILSEAGQCPDTVFVDRNSLDFRVRAGSGKLNIIEIVENEIITRRKIADPLVENGFVVADITRDIAKLVVVERHHGTGNVGVGFVSGFKIRRGAIASSVAHDSHNIIACGINDNDIKAAVDCVARMKGGLAVIENGCEKATLALPIAGLMADLPLDAVRQRLDDLNRAAGDLGIGLSDPFMTLSFLALPVIPELKLTDKGLFDVTSFSFVGLFE